MNNSVYDQIVVGAGISGLVYSWLKKSHGLNILVLEKSKGVGGRMATRRDEEQRYDHGAQYLKLQDPALNEIKKLLVENNIIQNWNFDYQKQSEFHFISPNGMTQIGKYLQKNQNILFSEKALRIQTLKESSNLIYEVVCESGLTFKSRKTVLSCPWPQSQEILKNSFISYPQDLNKIEYYKALVGLIQLDSPIQLKDDLIYLENVNSDIFSITNQSHKMKQPGYCYTIVMNPTFSDKYFERSDSEGSDILKSQFEAWLKQNQIQAKIIKFQYKKWRYSHPKMAYVEKFVSLAPDHQIVLIGDAFAGGSIQQAILSALSAAKII